MSKEKKFKIWLGVILGLGTFLLIGIGVAWFMLLIKPQTEELFAVNKEYDELKKTAGDLAPAKQALAAAEEKEKHLITQLAYFRNRYRAFDYGKWSPNTTALQPAELKAYQEIIWRKQMQEFSYDYGPKLLGELIGAAQASGVRMGGWDKLKLGVQDPPKGPEDLTIPPYGYYKPTGDAPLSLEITGSLEQILSFFTIIHKGEILKTVGSSLKLTGSSPNITASFTLQPYLLVKGEGVTLAGGGAAAPAAGGAGTTPSGGSAGSGSASPTGSATS